jgi:hypothetical protein
MRWSKQVKLGTFCVPVFSPSRCSTPVGASFVSDLKRGLNSGCHRSFDHPSSWPTGYWPTGLDMGISLRFALQSQHNPGYPWSSSWKGARLHDRRNGLQFATLLKRPLSTESTDFSRTTQWHHVHALVGCTAYHIRRRIPVELNLALVAVDQLRLEP